MARMWRLLVAFLLLLIASVFSRSQDVAADRFALVPLSAPSPNDPARESIPLPEPIGTPRRYALPPIRIAPPKIVSSAGIIFSGRVISVGRSDGYDAPEFGQGAGFTTITFQVEDAIRGTSAGQVLTVREWAGLWSSGEHYRVGERVFLFLYPPSKLGLTSPVAGAGARFAIDPLGEVVATQRNIASFDFDPVFAGRTHIPYADFIRAVRRASRQE